MSLRVWRSARRLGLRDKGKIGCYDDDTRLIHVFCRTFVRIGVDKEGCAHRYCWRCERLLDENEPNPKGRDDIPEPVALETTIADGTDVIRLEDHRKSA